MTVIKQIVYLALIASAGLIVFILAMGGPAWAASDLILAPNLSFTDDSSPNFPIEGKDLADATVSGVATLIFFGTSNCWNTAREAERLVTLYPKYRDRVHFVVVDLNHASSAQQRLAGQYYHGFIPTLAIFDKSGRVIYDRAGETASTRGDTQHLQELIDSALRYRKSAVAACWRGHLIRRLFSGWRRRDRDASMVTQSSIPKPVPSCFISCARP
jgi:hypothetical protein